MHIVNKFTTRIYLHINKFTSQPEYIQLKIRIHVHINTFTSQPEYMYTLTHSIDNQNICTLYILTHWIHNLHRLVCVVVHIQFTNDNTFMRLNYKLQHCNYVKYVWSFEGCIIRSYYCVEWPGRLCSWQIFFCLIFREDQREFNVIAADPEGVECLCLERE